MSTKDKKIKSSKADDKKSQKKSDDADVVDRSNADSTLTKEKEDGGNTVESSVNSDVKEVVNPEITEIETTEQEDVIMLTDVNKLTEILVERYKYLVIAFFFLLLLPSYSHNIYHFTSHLIDYLIF